MSDTDTIDATILEWHAKGVGLGGIANVLEALGLGQWTAKAVGAALKRLDIVRAAEAVFTPGEGEAEGWEGHGGDKFVRPWLDNTGRDVRDTGAPGEQGGEGVDIDTTFADRALEASERAEEADRDNPFKSTA